MISIMATPLRGLSRALTEYIRIHKLPEIYEALLCGLTVMTPEDHLTFILEKLLHLKEIGLDTLHWDMFIDEAMKPSNQIFTDSHLDRIFNFDEWLMPTPEMFTKAYSHYNYHVERMCFCALVQYHLMQKMKSAEMENKLNLAIQHHNLHLYRVCFKIWKEWVKYRKGRQAMSFQMIQHVYHVSLARIILEAWHNQTLEAQKQREYFERLERGEDMTEENLFLQGGGEAKDSVSTLPWKVAVQIFSHLDLVDLASCACVCRFWKVLTQANQLWSKLNFNKVNKSVTDKVATRLLSKARPYLVHLNMRACNRLQRAAFSGISECRNLQDMNLSECCSLDDDMMRVVTLGCHSLLFLNLAHTNISEGSLRAISRNCANLQYLSLASCSKFTDSGLSYLATGQCHDKLLYLDMSGCLQVTSQGFQHVADGCPNLESLILNEFPTLQDDCLMNIAETCTKINTLSFLGCPLLTDEVFKKFAQHRNLQVIKIDGNYRVSDASMKLVGKMCLGLRHIYLADCPRLTDATLKSLASCRNLVVLNLADCVKLSDSGIRLLMEGPASNKLRELNLTNCARVGDLAIISLHRRCRDLTYLKVNFCEHISEAGVELLGQVHSLISLDLTGCSFGDQALTALGSNSRLKDLVLAENTNISDLGVQKFVQQCKELERLDLSYCVNLTDAAIKNLAFCCRMLTTLKLTGCKHMTDLSIQYLSGVCGHLTRLDISGCIHISDKALKFLKKGCRKLKFLDMMYCKKITKRAVQKLQGHVEVVNYSYGEVPP